MRVLIVNDDGIASPALKGLAKWAERRFGQAVVVAPKREQSGKSQSIDFLHEIEIKRCDFEGIEAWTVDSTPADCVRFAMLELQKEGRFDLAFSGINRGFNLGHDIAYSGTVGAITECSRFSVPAIAFSTDTKQGAFDAALAHLDLAWGYVEENKLLERCGLYNINIPMAPKGILVTAIGASFYNDGFEKREGDLYFQIGSPDPNAIKAADDRYDTGAVWNGYISLTPITADRTNFDVLKELR